MKRIQYHRYGGASEMRLEKFDLPALGPSDIVILVKAAAANPIDWKVRNGTMKVMTGRKFPRAMGSDFSGIVEAVGMDVTRFKKGDEVFGTTAVKQSGAFAEAVVTNQNLITKKPPGLSFEQAAALPVVGVTAWRGLFNKGKLREGQSVFIHGCLGGVGRMAVQLAKATGAQVTGSCRAAAMEEARTLGIDAVVDFSAIDFALLKGQFDLVFDTVGSLPLADSRTLLKQCGIVLDINPTPTKMLRAIFLRSYKVVFGSPSAEIFSKLADAATAGKLVPLIGRIVPLSQAIGALADREKSLAPKGKLVIVPS